MYAYAFKKTVSFAIIHFAVAFLVTWAITGSWVLGGLVAMIEPVVNTVAYFFHEKVWLRLNARRELGKAAVAEDKDHLMPAS